MAVETFENVERIAIINAFQLRHEVFCLGKIKHLFVCTYSLKNRKKLNAEGWYVAWMGILH